MYPTPEGMPQQYLDLVGKSLFMSGGLFSRNKALPEEKYEVLAIRWGMARIFDMESLRKGEPRRFEHPTFELLVRSRSMERSRWTTPFPIREINLADTKESIQ